MYKFRGKVRRHNQRGRKLGFPTANVNLTKSTPEGVYISYAKIKISTYPALTFIGKAKTFNEKVFQAEVYILDFKQNIYGKWISVKLLRKIRGNKKFKFVEELVAQMKKDEAETRKYFGA
ncbi:riboflavin kinase [Candidatus Daviesbacteria bacterium]|nr:riboflavin kinase [Candidatus Daviesbacteria bacterium]